MKKGGVRAGLARRRLGLRRRALLGCAAAVIAAVAPLAPVHATTQTGGVVLDLFGGLHPFGGATVDTTGAPYWPNWDIARAATVLPDGSGGWTLDGFGGIHNWGAASQITTPAYWVNWDIARDLAVLPDGHSGYVLDGFGGIHAFGPKAPAFAAGGYWPGWDIARGIAVFTDGTGTATGGYVIDGFGGIHGFGSPAALSDPATYYPGRDVWRKLHLDGSGNPYTVGRWGIVADPSLSPDWTGYSDWGSWDATRDVVLLTTTGGSGAQPVSAAAQLEWSAATAQTGGVALDLYGGLHPFGGANVVTTGAPYWQNWDIARAAAVRPDGSGGWTLDGFGGIHNWGNAPAITTPGYWPNWDIARDLAVLPDGQSGYLLDGFGGLHAFGPNAPAFSNGPYWPNWDIARGLAVYTDSTGAATGGYVLDGFGGIHAFGSPPALTDPATYYANHPVWQKLHLSLDQRPYAVGKYGVVSAPGMKFLWSNYPDWGNWNATRDVTLFNPWVGSATQPLSAAASLAFYWDSHFLQPNAGVYQKPWCLSIEPHPPVTGKYIIISLACQELSAYQDGKLLVDTLVTTGRPALPTDKGHTQVLGKNHPFLMVSAWPYGSQYWYPPTWVQYATWVWSNGTAIHDAGWEPDSALGPGSENGPYASHGCIHVTLGVAQWIYSWADVGTAVDIV